MATNKQMSYVTKCNNVNYFLQGKHKYLQNIYLLFLDNKNQEYIIRITIILCSKTIILFLL